MMELITTHTHTALCGHADDSLRDMVDAGAAAGISTYAITEHYPLSHAVDPDHFVSMEAERVDEYFDEIEKARTAHPAMEIIAGCELDWLGPHEDRDLKREDFDRFELILGSVHFVDEWAFDDPSVRDRWDTEGPDVIWRHYVDLWCDAVTSDAPFTVMSHPDLVKKFGYYPSFDIEPLYAQMVEAISGTDRMIELNTSGAYYPCKEMYPSPRLLAQFCRAGVPCTIGTDAHATSTVARGIIDGYRVLYDAGYRVVTVPTRDGDRREVAIEFE